MFIEHLPTQRYFIDRPSNKENDRIMKTIPLFALAFSLFFLMACEKKEITVQETPGISSACANCVQFDDPAVGQLNKYVKFKGASFYKEDNPTITYEADTLYLEVIGKTDNEFTLEERVFSQPGQAVQYKLTVDKEGYYFSRGEKRANALLLPPLFRLENMDFLLNLDEAPSAAMKGWYIENNCDKQPCYYQLDQFGEREELKVFLDYSPMAYDGNGFYSIYDEKYLLRTTSIAAWTGEASGWELFLQ